MKRTHGPRQPRPLSPYCNAYPGGYCQGFEWSGYEATTSNHLAGVYRQAYDEFYVPQIPTSPSNAHVSIWAGVGGDSQVTNPNMLVQAGVDAYLKNGSQYNKSFWEVTGSNGSGFSEQNLPLQRLNTGDLVFASVSSNVNGNGEDYFFIKNETINNYNSCYLSTGGPTNTCGPSGSSSYNSDSASGQCIVERNGYYNQYGQWVPYPLADFNYKGQGSQDPNTLDVTYCNINNLSIGSTPHFERDIVNSNNTVLLDSTSDLDSSGLDFNETWYQGS